MTTPRQHAASSPLAVVTLLLLLLLLDSPAAAQQSPSRDKDNGDGGGGMPGQAPSFSAPMVVLLVALIAAVFFIGFFSVYMRRCGRGASAGPGIPAAALLVLSREEQRNQQQQRGLDPAVVASFPTMRYADAKALRVGGGKDAALECAVCLSEFEDDEELRLLPSCSHAFHPDCISEWLAGHVTCPVCRCNLDPEEPAAAEAASSGEETGEAQQQQQDQVVIDVSHDGAEEEDEEEDRRRREVAMELERIGSQRRAVRSRSGRPAAPPVPVPRSHSTGHSLATRLDGDLERFTLRLPEHVRREMVAAAGEESLRRTGPRERDARGNGGARSARLGRSDRWPSFIARTLSSRVPFWSASSRRAPDLEAAAVAAGTTGGSTRTRREKTGGASEGSVIPAKGSVRFDCLSGVAPAVTAARVGAAAGDSETEDDDDEEKAIARQRQA